MTGEDGNQGQGNGREGRNSTGQAIDPIGPADAGKVRWDYFVAVVITAEEEWRPELDHWSLELDGIHDWQVATDASAGDEETILVLPGEPREVNFHFIIQVGEDFEGQPMPEALHLSDPRLKFELE